MSVSSSATQRSFFPALRNSALLSFVLLLGITFLGLPPLLASIGAMLPLIWYHMLYLAPRARAGISQSAIDSVYYFGFLVTIAALGVSAISLSMSGAVESTDSIAFQFGLGLLATGYAVFARMHLTSISTWVDEQSPEGVLDRYLKRTQELVTNVEMASVQFSSLTTNLMTQSEAVTKHASETTERTMLAMSKAFDEQLRATLASGSQGLIELRGLISETSFTEERTALAQSMKVTLETMLILNKALSEFAIRSGEGARSTEAVSLASESLNDSLSQLSGRIDEIAGEDGTILRTLGNFDKVHSSATQATRALSSVVEEFGQIGSVLGGVGMTFKNLKTLTSKAQLQLEALIETSQQLDVATSLIATSAERTKGFSESLDSAAASLPKLEGDVIALRRQFNELRLTTVAVEQHLQGLPLPASTAISLANDLRDAFGGMHVVISAASNQIKAMTGHTGLHIDQSRQLSADVNHLRNSSQIILQMLAGIAESASHTNESLGKSASSLQTVVETASVALARDVETSSRAATMFSEKLAQVAGHIIDETRKVR